MTSHESLCRSVVAYVVEDLDERTREFVKSRIVWQFRPRPTAEDIEKGIEKDFEGAFVGVKVPADEDDDGDVELFEEEGSDVLQAERPEPGGVIVLFWENIDPLDEDEVEQVVLHELGHFLGDEEHDLEEAGIG